MYYSFKVKSVFVFTCAILSSWTYAATPTIEWTRQVGTNDSGSNGDDSFEGVTVDGLGGVYVTGFTEGSLFGSNAGGFDILLAKYDSQGDVVWDQQIGTSTSEFASAISADGLGNVFITGNFNSGGNKDFFIAKYETGGGLAWSNLGTSNMQGLGFSIDSDGLGNAYVAGYTSGGSFGPGFGLRDAFVAKYDTTGNLTWSRRFGTSATDEARGVAYDPLGNVYITGVTSGALDGTNAGSQDAFLTKYDSDGNFGWTKQFGTSAGDFGKRVFADAQGNVYVAGNTRGDLEDVNAGFADLFLRKYDTDGNLTWGKQFGTDQHELLQAITGDSVGNVYLSGFTRGDLDGTNAGGNDVFVIRLDTDGNIDWNKQFGTSASDDGNGLAVDGDGNVFVAGDTREDLDGSGPDVFAGGFGDAYVAKLLAVADESGDFDGSGTVDGADLVQWEASFGLNDAGDGDADGDSDGNDFLIWQRQAASTGIVSAFAQVPEPSTAFLVSFGTLFAGVFRCIA